MPRNEDGSIKIQVQLTPKSSRNAILGWKKDADGKDVLKVAVTAVPEKGKANKALVNLLSRELKTPKSHISIIRGDTHRSKTLLINNVSDYSRNLIKRL